MANHDRQKQRSKSESFWDHSVRVIHRTMAKNAQSKTPFKTPHRNTGKNLLSGPSPKSGQKWTTFDYFQDHRLKKVSKHWQLLSRLWRMDPKKIDSFQDPCKKSHKDGTLDTWFPVNEASWVISDPQMAKMAQPVKDQPLSGSPPKGLRFNHNLCGACFYIHWQRSPSIVPQQLWLHRWYVGRIWHQDRPYSPSSTIWKMESSHQVQGGDWERARRDGTSRNHHETDWAHTMGQLSHIPQEGKWQVDDMPWPKGLEQSHHPWEPQGTNPWGDSPCSHRMQQNSPKWMATKHSLGCTWQRQLHSLWHSTHTLADTDFSMCTIWTLNESRHFFQMRMDDTVAQCPGVLAIHDDVFIYGKDDKDHDANIINLFNVAQKEGLIFNSSKCSIKQDSVTFFGGVFSASGSSPDPGKHPRHHRDDTPSNKGGTTVIFGSSKLPADICPPPQSSHRTTMCTSSKRRTALHGMRTLMQVSRKLNPCCRKHCWNPRSTTWQK